MIDQVIDQGLIDTAYKCMYGGSFNDVEQIERFKKLRSWACTKGYSVEEVSKSISLAAEKYHSK